MILNQEIEEGLSRNSSMPLECSFTVAGSIRQTLASQS